MSGEEWASVKEALEVLWNPVKLKADGYELDLVLQRVGMYKNGISIYINGVFKAAWLLEDCEERRRFIQSRERSMLSARQKAEWRKLSKKVQKALLEKYDVRYKRYSTYWSSYGALKKRLLDTSKDIELISIGT